MPMQGATPERLLARVNAHELAFRTLIGRLLEVGALDGADVERIKLECLAIARHQQALPQTQQQVSGQRTETALRRLFEGLSTLE